MTTPASVSSVFTRSGFASGLSILLRAMMIGTFARLGVADRLEGLGHDAVVRRDDDHRDVGDLRARARIAVNASWPGVSRKTTRDRRGDLRWPDVLGDAAALPAATVVDLMASSRLVLPWSTWPMTVTIGARSTRSAGLSSVNSSSLVAAAGLLAVLAGGAAPAACGSATS
jgi:hypothetical protein